VAVDKKKMKIRVKSGVQVNKPAKEVMSYVQNVDRFPEWQGTLFKIGETKGVEGGRLSRSAAVTDRRNVLGKEIESQYAVTDVKEGKSFTMEVKEGPIYWAMTFSVEEVDGGAFLTAEGGGDLGKIALSEGATARSCQRMLETDLHTLRDALEAH
jgi:hypothetical protein